MTLLDLQILNLAFIFETVNHSELDDVWSIKKNVSVSGGKQRPMGNEGLNLKANTTYYSRYGGVKGRTWQILYMDFCVTCET